MTVILGGYPAKQCGRATHNKYHPDSPPEPEMSIDKKQIVEQGNIFEQQTAIPAIIAAAKQTGKTYLLIPFNTPWDKATQQTLQATQDGIDIIINGRLPNTPTRSGAPDVLIKAEDGYLPVDIKNHSTIKEGKRGSVPLSHIGNPWETKKDTPATLYTDHWKDDARQLAHYTRMLQELNLHPQPTTDNHMLWGGIIGTSAVDGNLTICWHNLDEKKETTYSKTAAGNKKKRSALERYDYEFALRLHIAQQASQGNEAVQPVRIRDCDTCVWKTFCKEKAGPDDASFALPASTLDTLEWQYLHTAAGGTSVAHIAKLNPQEHFDSYKTYAISKPTPDKRLTDLVRRANMKLNGTPIEPVSTWPEIPQADIEVDFDIEWDEDGHIYQWGLYIRENQQQGNYDPVVSFEQPTHENMAALAQQFADKINELKTKAAQENKTIQIYHWTAVEIHRTKHIPEVAQVLDGVCFDLHKWLADNFILIDSGSIKKVAPIFKYTWRVDNPGGLFSQTQIMQARKDGPQSKAAEWVLGYNYSDVEAQAVIRDGIRALKPVEY